jgi:hypothetical protein
MDTNVDRRKYANLRLQIAKDAALPGAAGAALLLAPEAAMAQGTVNLSTSSTAVSAGGAFWVLANSATAIPSGPAGLGIPFAAIGGTGSSSSGGVAYEGAFVMTVNGTAYSVPNGIMDVSGTLYSSQAGTTMSGLKVNAQYYFDTGSPTVRVIYTYTNSTASPITVTIQLQNNLGGSEFLDVSSKKHHARVARSGERRAPVARSRQVTGPSTTSVVLTSSGDSTESAADRWVVTRSGGQAYIDTVRFGPTAAVTPTMVCEPGVACAAAWNAQNLLIDQYTLTVPANQTRALMFFGRISATSTINTSTFNSIATVSSSGLLGNLPTGLAESQIVNWFGGSGVPSVPAASWLSLLLTGALIVALGMKFLKRPLERR